MKLSFIMAINVLREMCENKVHIGSVDSTAFREIAEALRQIVVDDGLDDL